MCVNILETLKCIIFYLSRTVNNEREQPLTNRVGSYFRCITCSVHSFSFLHVLPVRVSAHRFLVLQQICLFIGTYYVKTRYTYTRPHNVHLINYSLIRTHIIILYMTWNLLVVQVTLYNTCVLIGLYVFVLF